MPDKDTGDAEAGRMLARSRSLALELIRAGRVMTLSTASDEGAWAAPVYYYYRDRAFFFFSSEKARHIRDIEDHPYPCAAAVYEDPDPVEPDGIPFEGTRFDGIRGIQMSGRVEKAARSLETVKTAAGYLKRFGIPADGPSDCLSQIETAFRARFFRFVPERIFYMDNSLGFGTRIEIGKEISKEISL